MFQNFLSVNEKPKMKKEKKKRAPRLSYCAATDLLSEASSGVRGDIKQTSPAGSLWNEKRNF